MKIKSNFFSKLFQWFLCIGTAIILSLTLKTYVVSAISVDGESMMPTLNNNDRLFIEKISLIDDNIKKGEIVIFDSKDSKHDLYVKRVIALEGDQIQIKEGKVFVNDKQLNETYLGKNTVTNGGTFLKEGDKIIIPKGSVFVLGDNRCNSNDSRFFGPVHIKDLKGHVILRTFPFDSIKGF